MDKMPEMPDTFLISDVSGIPLKGDEPKRNPSRKSNSFSFDEGKQDGGNGGIPFSVPDPKELGDEHEFEESAPEPKPRKRKSIFEQLGILKPEKRELTEEERRKADELAAKASKFLAAEKSEDSWPGLDSGIAF